MKEQSLIYQIFEPKQAKLLSDLYNNESVEGKQIIYQVITSQLARSDKIVLGQELNQLVLLMTEAHFLLSEEEPLQVGVMLFWGLKQTDILPKISENSGKSLGAKCLVSLSLFETALQRKCSRFGAPSPSFYRDIGKAVLKTEKMEEVSLNFDRWTNFIGEHLI